MARERPEYQVADFARALEAGAPPNPLWPTLVKVISSAPVNGPVSRNGITAEKGGIR